MNDYIRHIVREVLNEMLIKETDYNYHVSREKKDIKGNGIPYASDRRDNIRSRRGTGHFGSGTYFASYKEKDYNKSSQDNINPKFIKIGEGLYRVDMDFYKNLYRVKSKEEADVLFETLRLLNGMEANIASKIYDNAHLYQKIHNNIFYLELEDISYNDLIRMMQRYAKENHEKSFSTYFMEYNGYNGVNVSGINDYDNTKHGSVIYNLDNTTIRKVSPKKDKKDVSDISKDSNIRFINGDFIENAENMDIQAQIRYVKNVLYNHHLLDNNIIKNLNEKAIRIYFKMLYNLRNVCDNLGYNSLDILIRRKEYYYFIVKYDLFYYVNLPKSSNETSVFIMLLNEMSNFYSNNEELLIKKINEMISVLNRPLTNEEKNILKYFNIA